MYNWVLCALFIHCLLDSFALASQSTVEVNEREREKENGKKARLTKRAEGGWLCCTMNARAATAASANWRQHQLTFECASSSSRVKALRAKQSRCKRSASCIEFTGISCLCCLCCLCCCWRVVRSCNRLNPGFSHTHSQHCNKWTLVAVLADQLALARNQFLLSATSWFLVEPTNWFNFWCFQRLLHFQASSFILGQTSSSKKRWLERILYSSSSSRSIWGWERWWWWWSMFVRKNKRNLIESAHAACALIHSLTHTDKQFSRSKSRHTQDTNFHSLFCAQQKTRGIKISNDKSEQVAAADIKQQVAHASCCYFSYSNSRAIKCLCVWVWAQFSIIDQQLLCVWQQQQDDKTFFFLLLACFYQLDSVCNNSATSVGGGNFILILSVSKAHSHLTLAPIGMCTRNTCLETKSERKKRNGSKKMIVSLVHCQAQEKERKKLNQGKGKSSQVPQNQKKLTHSAATDLERVKFPSLDDQLHSTATTTTPPTQHSTNLLHLGAFLPRTHSTNFSANFFCQERKREREKKKAKRG